MSFVNPQRFFYRFCGFSCSGLFTIVTKTREKILCVDLFRNFSISFVVFANRLAHLSFLVGRLLLLSLPFIDILMAFLNLSCGQKFVPRFFICFHVSKVFFSLAQSYRNMVIFITSNGTPIVRLWREISLPSQRALTICRYILKF